MARRRFFVDQAGNGRAALSGDDARHLRQVLRAEPGQRYEISDGGRVYLAEIDDVARDRVTFRLIEEIEAAPPPLSLTLLLALIKFDRFEWALEKATELGVETIVPVRAARSDKGLERAAEKRLERWRKIVREASEQARRARLPAVSAPAAFAEAIAAPGSHSYLLDERRDAPPLLRALPAEKKGTDAVTLLVGPEGGWTGEERARALAAGWTAVSLGPLVLRAETAAAAGLALLAGAWLEAAAKER